MTNNPNNDKDKKTVQMTIMILSVTVSYILFNMPFLVYECNDKSNQNNQLCGYCTGENEWSCIDGMTFKHGNMIMGHYFFICLLASALIGFGH